jgi:hypothetical protein
VSEPSTQPGQQSPIKSPSGADSLKKTVAGADAGDANIDEHDDIETGAGTDDESDDEGSSVER